MIPLTLAEVATAVDGRLAGGATPDHRVTGPVVVDSRAARPGGLFVAIKGERVDGHDFAAGAVAAGAVAALAERPVGAPAVVVPGDTVTALGRLARYVVDRLEATDIVGVTGSSGKTTTKDLLAQVLTRSGRTVVPPGSYNNEIGLPLTALRADPSTRYLVLEMGARGADHIARLCMIAPPSVGVVLNVGSAHLGEFGGRAGVARAKGELVAALPPGGLAVLNADDELVRAMADRTRARVNTFGLAAHADVRAVDVRLEELGRPGFTLVAAGGTARVHLRFHGAHNISNALATATVALAGGLPLDEVAAALSGAAPLSKWRMEVTERPDGVTIINDAYNANPESVRAALEALVAIAGGSPGRRTWAVLGEMRELGPDSPVEHDRIGRLAERLGVSRLVVVGEGAKSMARAESAFVPDVRAATALLDEELRPGDVVLVKASRAAGLEAVAQALVAGEGAACG